MVSGVSLSTAEERFPMLGALERWRETGLDEHGEIIIYQAEDGLAKIDVRVADETVRK